MRSISTVFLLCLLYKSYSSLHKTKDTRNCRPIEEQVYLYARCLQYAIVEPFKGKEIYELASAKFHVYGFDIIIYPGDGTGVGF